MDFTQTALALLGGIGIGTVLGAWINSKASRAVKHADLREAARVAQIRDRVERIETVEAALRDAAQAGDRYVLALSTLRGVHAQKGKDAAWDARRPYYEAISNERSRLRFLLAGLDDDGLRQACEAAVEVIEPLQDSPPYEKGNYASRSVEDSWGMARGGQLVIDAIENLAAARRAAIAEMGNVTIP